MTVNVLVVDIHAELYRDRLLAEFPDLQFRLFHSAAEVSGDLPEPAPGSSVRPSANCCKDWECTLLALAAHRARRLDLMR